MSHARFDDTFGANPAENYERFFVPLIGRPLATHLLQRARVRPTDRVLDVACGTGIVARLLSEVLSPEGTLAGLDPNGAMLEVARAKTPPGPEIQWHKASAEEMPLPAESFDVVLCQMGLQFMSDRSAALREMRRVLRSGGRLLLSVPGPMTGIFADLASALEKHIGPQAAGFVGRVFSLHDIDEVQRLVQGAGLEDVEVTATSHDLELSEPQEFLWQYIHSTPLSAVVAQATPESLAELERDVVHAWSDSVHGGVLTQRVRMVVAGATKAAA